MGPTTSRDQAVVTAIKLVRYLFGWVHLTWSPDWEAAVARLVDLIIAAAAEEARRHESSALLAEINAEPPPARPVNPGRAQTVTLHREERRAADHAPTAEDDARYQAWRRQQDRRTDRETVSTMLRREGK